MAYIPQSLMRPLAWLLLGCLISWPVAAQAHFIFLVPQSTSDQTQNILLGFGEGPEPTGTKLLGDRQLAELQILTASGTAAKAWERADGKILVRDVPSHALLLHQLTYGVITRGEQTSLLHYYSATGPAAGDAVWSERLSRTAQRLVVIPHWADGTLKLQVFFDGKPAEASEVVLSSPSREVVLETDAEGMVVTEPPHTGEWGIRARVVHDESGTYDDQAYERELHYATLTLDLPTPASPAETAVLPQELAPLENPVTSFGGAVLKGSLYIYGGHFGNAHEYSDEGHSKSLMRLPLTADGSWEEVATGPGLQGLALVSDGEALYRLGGFSAKNKAGEEHDLWSQDDVARFNVETGAWEALPALPEPRSSFDAVCHDGKIYVIGGWTLQGDQPTQWLETAYVLDLNADELKWEAIAAPPFQRRALAVAAYQDRVFVIGGMQKNAGPTTEVAIYDPQTNTWSEGPAIDGEAMAGFGSSAFATGGNLYVSTVEGVLQRLAADGQSWEVARELAVGRFFHRMLPIDDQHLVIVGGANMEIGKFSEVEVIDLSQDNEVARR